MKYFNKALTYFNYYQDRFFVTEYEPYPDNYNGRGHMLVFRIPRRYHNAYDHFLKGEYSKMYTEAEVNFLFSAPLDIPNGEVVLQTKHATKNFLNNFNEEFNVNLKLEEIQGWELDHPLKKCEEIFNCVQDGRIYFKEELDKVNI